MIRDELDADLLSALPDNFVQAVQIISLALPAGALMFAIVTGGLYVTSNVEPNADDNTVAILSLAHALLAFSAWPMAKKHHARPR